MPFSICTPVSANWPESDRITPILMVSCAAPAPGIRAAAASAAPASNKRFMSIPPPWTDIVVMALECPSLRAKKSAANSAFAARLISWLAAEACFRPIFAPFPAAKRWAPNYSAAQGRRPNASAERDDRLLVAPGAQIAVREDAVRGDPVARLLVDVGGVGLEHQPLARAPAPRVHLGVEALGKLVLVIMRVLLRPQVDVALRAAQRLEEFAQIFRVRVAVDHGGDHEGGVEHF